MDAFDKLKHTLAGLYQLPYDALFPGEHTDEMLEKTKNGLTLCAEMHEYKTDCENIKCPYICETGCIAKLAKDVLSILHEKDRLLLNCATLQDANDAINRAVFSKLQMLGQPRLLTLYEAKTTSGHGYEETWFDPDEEEGTGEYISLFECAFINGHIVCAEGDTGQVEKETYNRPRHSRLWIGNRPPTEAEREALPWDGT